MDRYMSPKAGGFVDVSQQNGTLQLNVVDVVDEVTESCVGLTVAESKLVRKRLKDAERACKEYLAQAT